MSLLLLLSQQPILLTGATTDGADVLAAVVGPVVGATSASTDGSDVAAAAVAPVIGASSATVDGSDVLAAAVDPVTASVSASAAIAEGSDILAAFVATTAGAGHTSEPRRKWAVQVGKTLRLFESDEELAEYEASLAPAAKPLRKVQLKPAEAAQAPESVNALPMYQAPPSGAFAGPVVMPKAMLPMVEQAMRMLADGPVLAVTDDDDEEALMLLLSY